MMGRGDRYIWDEGTGTLSHFYGFRLVGQGTCPLVPNVPVPPSHVSVGGIIIVIFYLFML
jgi:hypothetical protein